MLYLASNMNDAVVVEQKTEGWTLVVKSAQSNLRRHGVEGFVRPKDLALVIEDMKAFDKNKRAKVLYEVDFVGTFVMSAYNQSTAFSPLVCNPSWIAEHVTNIYGKVSSCLALSSSLSF